MKKYLLALGLGSALILGACSNDKEEAEKDAPVTLEQEEHGRKVPGTKTILKTYYNLVRK